MQLLSRSEPHCTYSKDNSEGKGIKKEVGKP